MLLRYQTLQQYADGGGGVATTPVWWQFVFRWLVLAAVHPRKLTTYTLTPTRSEIWYHLKVRHVILTTSPIGTITSIYPCKKFRCDGDRLRIFEVTRI